MACRWLSSGPRMDQNSRRRARQFHKLSCRVAANVRSCRGMFSDSQASSDLRVPSLGGHARLSLDVGNLSCFEQMVRRIVQLGMVVDKNPNHPDFTGLGVLVDATTTSTGASRVPRFTSWVSARQKEQHEMFKQRRLYIEKQSKTQKSVWHGGAETKRASKPKPKPKA